jgi:hypothetical protein
VQFTYKGKRSYQTNIGAVVSIGVKAILAFFVVYEFYTIFSRKHPMTTIKTVVNNFAVDPAAHISPWNPREKGFDVGISLLKPSSGMRTRRRRLEEELS